MPGSMAPNIVLLPGLDGSGRMFSRLQHELAREATSRAVAYPSDRPLGYDDLVAYAADQLGEESVFLLGESFSGPIAVQIAARFPKRIEGLILAATFATPPLPPMLLQIGARMNVRLIPKAIVHAFLRGTQHDPEIAAEINSLMDALPPGVLSARLAEVAKVDVRDALRRVGCPILILHGTSDWLVFPGEARQMAAIKPAARVRFLPGPHMILQRAAEPAAREILAFMQMCDARKACS